MLVVEKIKSQFEQLAIQLEKREEKLLEEAHKWKLCQIE
jgi:hypothetical protein